MSYPGLAHDDHRILGSDFCSGYIDVYGKWSTGFYCPQHSPTIPVFCCGTAYYKYCCVARPDSLNGREPSEEVDRFPTDDDTPFTVRVPVFFAIFCGVLAIIVLLVTAICFFCSCCVVYKKRRSRCDDNGPFSGLYHIQGSSSTTSALASIYSTQNSNNSVVSTPLDGDGWGGGGGISNFLFPNGYIPYPYSTLSNNNLVNHHYATPSLSSTSTSAYPSSLTLSSRNALSSSFLNSNPNLSFYNNLNLNNNNQANRRNQNFSSLSSIYEQDNHPTVGDEGSRPASVLSSYSNSSSIPSTLPRSQNLGPPPAYSFRPICGPNSGQTRESIHLNHQAQLQQLLSLQSSTGVGRRPPVNGVQQTRFINQLPESNTIRVPNSNTTTTTSQQQQANQNLRQILLEREQQRSRLNLNGSNNTSRPVPSPRVQNNCNHAPLSQQERQSLATIQSLINAYRNNCSSGQASQLSPPPLPLTQPAGNASLTTADVNRLNAINLLVSTLLNQRQNLGGERGRVLVSSENAPSNRPPPQLLALLDGVIRGSTTSPTNSCSASGSGSIGESSVNSGGSNNTFTTSTSFETTTSGIGGSISGTDIGSGDSCGSSHTTGKTKSGDSLHSPLKIMDISDCKNFSNQNSEGEIQEKVCHFGSTASENENIDVNLDLDDDAEIDKIEKGIAKQNQIIEIIETIVPLQDDEKKIEEKVNCFDVGEEVDKEEENEDKLMKQVEDQDYVQDSSSEDGTGNINANLFREEELSLEGNHNLKLESDCCYDQKMDCATKQETSVLIDEMSVESGDKDKKFVFQVSPKNNPCDTQIEIFPPPPLQIEQISDSS